jgi:hypothetical protein
VSDFEASISDAQLIKLIIKKSGSSELIDYDPLFKLGASRVFTVSAVDEVIRGGHAHRRATQWLIATTGVITVEMFDGESRTRIVLQSPDNALQIPCGIWSVQTYKRNSNLMVFSSEAYEESEYIRTMAEFEELRR